MNEPARQMATRQGKTQRPIVSAGRLGASGLGLVSPSMVILNDPDRIRP